MESSVSFSTRLLKFEENAEKTGWTYIEVPAELAQQLKPGNKKSFRVKGAIDQYKVSGVALLPAGNGSFIMAINATMRKGIRKRHGAMVEVKLALDKKEYILNKDFMTCLDDEPEAMAFFNTLPRSHQNYFSKWIDSAKTEATKIKRMTMAVTGLSKKLGYGPMLHYFRDREL